MSLAFTLTPTSINILLDGRMRTINKSHMNFDAVVDIVRQIGKTTDVLVKHNKMDALRELIDIKSFIARVTEGRVQIGDTSVQFDGVPVHSVVATRLVKMLGEGFDVRPMARFLEKMRSNPSLTAQDELYIWLEHSALPITSDGDFIAFKKVREDYKSYHDGTTDNSIGSKPFVPRDTCDPSRNNTCSSGLHFCSFDYLPNYMGDEGRVVICKINPADVTAIPNDYNNAKGRAWTYEIIGEVPEDEAKAAFPAPVVSSFGTYSDDGENDTYDGADDTDADDHNDYDYDFGDNHNDYNDAGTADILAETVADPLPDPLGGPDFMPSGVDEDAFRKVLGGDASELADAFCWADTPQGADVWRNAWVNEVIPVELLAILAVWAKRIGVTTKPDPLTGMTDTDLLACCRMYGNDTIDVMIERINTAFDGTRALSDAFWWNMMPQGLGFWLDQADTGPSFRARVFMLHMIRQLVAIRDRSGVPVKPAPVSSDIPAPEADYDPTDEQLMNIFLIDQSSTDLCREINDAIRAARLCLADSRKLMTAFSWARTPQGPDFWCSALINMTEEAEVILLGMIRRLEAIIEKEAAKTVQKEFTHGNTKLTAGEVKHYLKQHGQRGMARLFGIPRTTLQEWAKRLD